MIKIRLFLLVVACVGVGIAGVSLRSWESARVSKQKTKSAIAVDQRQVGDLSVQERQQAETLKSAVAKIQVLKRRVASPADAIRELPTYLELPEPITAVAIPKAGGSVAGVGVPGEAGVGAGAGIGPKANLSAAGFYLPANDAKPLFDSVQDARVCDLQLEAAQIDLVDERGKIANLTAERDLALKAKSETMGHRLKRNGKWLLIGAGVTLALTAGRGRK